MEDPKSHPPQDGAATEAEGEDGFSPQRSQRRAARMARAQAQKEIEERLASAALASVAASRGDESVDYTEAKVGRRQADAAGGDRRGADAGGDRRGAHAGGDPRGADAQTGPAETPPTLPANLAASGRRVSDDRRGVGGQERLPAIRGPGTKVAKIAPAKGGSGTLLDSRAEADFTSDAIERAKRLRGIRAELIRRRRVAALWLFVRFSLFVFGPTALIANYFYNQATPIYVSEASFLVQSADPVGASGGLGNIFSGTGFANLREAVAAQDYILSKEVLRRLEEDHGYITHFQGPEMDWLQRLAPDASFEDAHSFYHGGLVLPGMVEIGFDSAEGIFRMKVSAADPDKSREFATALIRYAEEKVDSLSDRSKRDQLDAANEGVEKARAALVDAQTRAVDVQERLKLYSVQGEAVRVDTQIGAAESLISEYQAQIDQLLQVTREGDSRITALRQRIDAQLNVIARLREQLVGDEAGSTPSLARLNGELQRAQLEEQMAAQLWASAIQTMEQATQTVSQQTRYLSVVEAPTLPDEATRPNKLGNTALAFLICFGIYILASLTFGLLREQANI